jgi:hypothetical protein
MFTSNIYQMKTTINELPVGIAHVKMVQEQLIAAHI